MVHDIKGVGLISNFKDFLRIKFEISNTCDDSRLAHAFEDVVECILMQFRVQTHPQARLFLFKHINGRARVYVYMCVRERTRAYVIIMYIYHALINALSAHMIHINLNNIQYTHRAQSYQNNLHKVLYGNTHARTHNDYRSWVLILVGVEIL